MDFKITWTDSAIHNLREICSYISRDNPKAARAIGKGILEHARLLSSFPHIGPPYPRNSQGNVREIVYRSYRIFYEINESARSVEILHVWHGARAEPPPMD